MKRLPCPWLIRTLAALPGLCAAWLLTGAELPEPADGHWEGAIQLPATALAIRVDLAVSGGAWSGTIDIPVQGLRGYKLDRVSVAEGRVRFVMPGVPGDPSFDGRLAPETHRITGDFSQGGQKYPFALDRRAAAPSAGEMPRKGLPGAGLAGYWLGALKPAPVIELRVALEITNATAAGPSGVMVSLDQGDARLPLTEATEQGGRVRLAVASIGGTFDGTLSSDGAEISGEWRQNGGKLPLTFLRMDRAPRLARPQEPQKPYPYREEDVRFASTAPGVQLAGTFTRPPAAGRYPAVVLLTGSGPQDRDEAIMGHRPFLVLADHLTRHGLAVLRYDDRGVGKSTGNFGQAVHTDFVADALAAVAWLKARPEVDARRIGLIGHSEGGIVAPLAAVQSGDVAFLVLLAGVGVPTDQLLLRQGADLARVMGAGEELMAKSAAAQRATFEILKSDLEPAEAERRLRELTARQLAEFTAEQRAAMGMSEAMIENQIRTALTPWFRQLLAYDPRPTLRRVKCPVLALNGEKDLQVAAGENLQGIREALALGGNPRVVVREFPGLNHLFQKCTTGAVSEYGQIEETLNPEVLRTVSDWILALPGK